ncbi:MAG: zinc-binding dehydrogenase [Butyricicoccus sp.]
MATMQAAIFKGNGVLEVEQVEVPKIQRPDQVLIQVRATSICGSDLHALRVPPGLKIPEGIVLGHEFFGTIVETGADVKRYQVGDTVAVDPCVPCGECWECKHGLGYMCSDKRHYGQTCDGSFAQYVLVEASQLHRVPADINPDAAAQAEPLACILCGIEKLNPKPTDHILLYGAGPIGLTFIRALKVYGVKHLAVVAKGAARIAEAKHCGAEFVIDMQQGGVEEALAAHWDEPADIVIDAVGAGSVLTEALHLLHTRGRVLLFGYNEHARAEVPPSLITAKEIQIMGVLGKSFPSAIALLGDEQLGLAEFVSHRLPLSEIGRGIELLMNKEATRVILYPNGDIPE